ncbi:ferredoxin [Candidatus Woesearchaeota archaeon]|nr:ferredoxin [Candidatus Woesearchaeota archaeon]
MTKFKIEHDRPACIGCGACAAVAPEFWYMHDDGKSDIKGAKATKKGDEIILEELELDDLKNNMEAAEVCPVNCIHIFEDGKKKI